MKYKNNIKAKWDKLPRWTQVIIILPIRRIIEILLILMIIVIIVPLMIIYLILILVEVILDIIALPFMLVKKTINKYND